MKFHTLDILRGFAALWVFTYHFPFYSAANVHPALLEFFRLGHYGVPMFFVISGYCMLASARAVQKRKESVGSFVYRRLLRIYPPFWFSVLLIVALPFVIEAISSVKTGTFVAPELSYAGYDWLDWLRIATLTQVFFSHGEGLQAAFSGINSVYWTLAIEVQFYLVIALALAAGRRFAWLLVGVTAVACGFVLVPMSYHTGVFLPYWPMFAAGLLLYRVLEKGLTPAAIFGRGTTWACALLGPVLFAGLCALLLLPAKPVNYLGFALLMTPVFWLLHGLDEPVGRLRDSKVMVIAWPTRLLFLLGAASYSLYLLHGRLVALGAQLVRQVVRIDSPLFPVLVIGVTTVMCFAFYFFCEKPFIKKRMAAPAPKPAEARAEVVAA